MKKKSTRDSQLDGALDILQRLFNKSSGRFSNEYQRLRLEKNWKNIVGVELAKETFPRKLYETTLYVAASSSEAQYHFKFSSDIIIKKINDFFGKEVVKHLSFKNKPLKSDQDYQNKANKIFDSNL